MELLDWEAEGIPKIKAANEEPGLPWDEYFAILDSVQFFSTTAHIPEDAAFGDFLVDFAPRRIVEFGTGPGHFSNIILRACPNDATLVTMDIGDGPTFYRLPLVAKDGQTVVGFPADSRAPETMERVQGILGPEPVDLIFIDTDHSAETTREEADLWLPYVKQGGGLGFHDIYTDKEGVQVVWRDLQRAFPTNYEFVSPGATMGVGVAIKE
jgi:predicted O-methyltransferase YrrM